MTRAVGLIALGLSLAGITSVGAALSQSYTWKNVKIGGGGGFVPNIVFHPNKSGIAYARTDIGYVYHDCRAGLYKLNYADDTWTPLTDWVGNNDWNKWGIDALALDARDPARVYVAAGMYTNSWDPNNGQIMRSTDYGATWSSFALPFKVGGNMPGRGTGERLAVDPNLGSTLFFGARNGNGLLKSTDYGATWTKVSTFTSTGTYQPDPNDPNGYSNTIIGLTFVTFDPTSGTAGSATKRIFAGVATNGTSNVFVSEDAGATWSALAGQQTKYFPHKGVFSAAEKVLYVSYADGAGPYDGTAGALYKYDLTTKVWTEISPLSVANGAYYGYGGLAIDAQKPGVIMVAALNSWWPDGNIFRSNNSGATWTSLWEWTSYPTAAHYYGFDSSLAPWLGGPISNSDTENKRIGWMMEGLSIDPFDSNHWLYGTGATVYGSHDLLRWDTVHNVTIKSLADGIEETAIQDLISPPTGANLISGVADIGGFVHSSLTTPPKSTFLTPSWTTTSGLDWAGNSPTKLVRVGSDTGTKQVAVSTDSGLTWNEDYGAADGVNGGKVAYSADADTVLWSSGTNGVLVSHFTNAFTAVSSLPSGSSIASDKKLNAVFYASSGGKFYISTDTGATFTSTATLGASNATADIVVNAGVSGDVWVTTNAGLFHTTDSGKTFSQISGFTAGYSVSLGAPKTTGGYPAIYLGATYLGATGYFRSDDAGVNFIQINDAAHQFGAISANPVCGDSRVYGRVYIGTNGRGIFYGDASGTAPGGTATGSPSSTSKPVSSSSSVPVTTSSKPITTTTAISTSTSKPVTSTTTSKPVSSTTTSKATSTTTKTSSAPATTTSSSSGTAPLYGQCGGASWSGPTVCASGKCTAQNEFYSQCLP